MSKKVLGFPKGFFWGAASASYQVEGGIANNDWAVAGQKGIVPPSDLGPDHFNRYEEDFDLAKSLGHNCHRLSIEWSRIEPEEGRFDQNAIEHYREVLETLKDRQITPFITIWHFTIPQWLLEKGGLESKEFPEIFSRYAVFVVKELKDLCDHWATMNEPNVMAGNGWVAGVWSPFKKGKIFKARKVLKNLAKAHILAYKKIKDEALVTEVGVVKNNMLLHSDWKPWNKILKVSLEWFWNHWFLDMVKNHTDSIGLNYYKHHHFGQKRTERETSDMGWELYPEGIYYILLDLKKRYGKPIFISEAGLADEKDTKRARYIKDMVYWMYRAIENGVPLKGFMYWSLLDNYEWAHGYTKRFGLIEINYETKERIVRPSAYEYKKICEENALIIDNN